MTPDTIKLLKEIISKSTKVNSWYAHRSCEDCGPNEATVRGPFGRWLIVVGGQDPHTASVEDDAKYCAAAMNWLPALITENDSLLSENERLRAQLELAKDALKNCVEDRHYYGTFPRHTEALAEIDRIGGGG